MQQVVRFLPVWQCFTKFCHNSYANERDTFLAFGCTAQSISCSSQKVYVPLSLTQLYQPALLSFMGDGRHLWGGCCGWPRPFLSSGTQLTPFRGPSLSRTATYQCGRGNNLLQLNWTQVQQSVFLLCPTNTRPHALIYSTFLFILMLLCYLSEGFFIFISYSTFRGLYIPRKPRDSQCRED